MRAWRGNKGRSSDGVRQDDVSRFVSRRKSYIQCDITDSAVGLRAGDAGRDECASCVRMQVHRESTPATVDTQRRFAVAG